jgi:hypothetical protein
MGKIFSLFLILLLVTTILSSVYHLAIDDRVYAQLYSKPIEEQPLDTFNNQPLDMHADADESEDENNGLLSDITVEDIEGEEQQRQTQSPYQQTEEQPLEEQPLEEQPLEEQPLEEQPLEEQPLEEQPLEELNLSQMPENNLESAVKAPTHNYGTKVDDFLEELHASLSYQTAS